MIQLRESKAWQMLPRGHLQKVGSKFWASVTLNGERQEEVRLSPPPLTNQGSVSGTLRVDVGYLGLSKGMGCKRLINSHLMKPVIAKFLLLWSSVDPENLKVVFSFCYSDSMYWTMTLSSTFPLWSSGWVKLDTAQNTHIPCDHCENQTLKLKNLWYYKQNQHCKAKQRLEKRYLNWKQQ